MTDAVRSFTAPEGVELRADVPAAAAMRGDGRLLRALVDNLVSNALRHTRAGSVTVRVAAHPGGWRIEVADTGEGIPADHLDKVFERFHRVDAARSRADGGAGLGLSIVRAVAEQHGGRVTVRSTVGKGTVLTVELATPM